MQLSNSLKTQPKFTLSHTVEKIKHEDNIVLSDWERGQFYGLDSFTAMLLDAIIESKTETIIDEISNQYNVPSEEIEKDIQELTKDLLNNKIIRYIDSETISLPNSLQIRLLLILARCSYKLLGLLPTIRLWRCFHNPIPRELTASDKEQLIETLSSRIQEECSKTFPFNVDCKERALVGWTILRGIGLPSELILAAQYYPFRMHAWSECSGIIVGDDAKRCSYWTPVKKFT